jgi:hypothetical protein
LCPVKYCTEDAIDKTAGRVAPKELGQLHRFVNGCLRWYRIIKQNLVDCKSEYVFVDSGHLLQWPFSSCTLDVRVDLGKVVANTLGQFSSILHHLWLQVALLGVPLQDLGWRVLSRVVFVECLQGDHARLPAYPYWHTSLVPVYVHPGRCILLYTAPIASPSTPYRFVALCHVLDVNIDFVDLHTDDVLKRLGHFLLDGCANLDYVYSGFDYNIQVG